MASTDCLVCLQSFILPSSIRCADSPSKKGKHSSKSKKRERESAGSRSATPEVPANGSATPPAKKPKPEVSSASITVDEVKRYLMRKPITSKDLVRKFTSKKTEMDRNKIVEVLHKIIKALENVEKQTVKGKLYLSLKTPGS